MLGFADDKWTYRLERAVARSACVGDKIMLLFGFGIKDISCGPTENISCQQAQAHLVVKKAMRFSESER
jgi:hypothetical protein